MTRVALLLAYLGSAFCGSQYQVGVRTVQSELERALAILARAPVAAVFAGRTDSGVHARGQVVHLDWPGEIEDAERFAWSLNGILPDDLAVFEAQPVPADFHARFTASSRTYAYRILNHPQRCPLARETHYFVSRPLDINAMVSATAGLTGSHDFAAFRGSNSDRLTTTCQVLHCQLFNLGEGVLEFWIEANHFVYNMVRIVVGTLVEIGLRKRSPTALAEALERGDRRLAGATAPPWGLTLESIDYPPAYNLFTSRRGSFPQE